MALLPFSEACLSKIELSIVERRINEKINHVVICFNDVHGNNRMIHLSARFDHFLVDGMEKYKTRRHSFMTKSYKIMVFKGSASITTN